MRKNLKIQEFLDRNIKELWLNQIVSDYDNGNILLEDALKCSFYYHLRNKLGNQWLLENNIRIFPEFHLSKGRKADIAIVKMKENFDFNKAHLRDCVDRVLSIIEFKYKGSVILDCFFNDRDKLKGYAFDYKEAQLYVGFIHEYQYPSGPKWFDARQTNTWANKRVSELLGYWDSEGDSVFEVKSYNGLNRELDGRSGVTMNKRMTRLR